MKDKEETGPVQGSDLSPASKNPSEIVKSKESADAEKSQAVSRDVVLPRQEYEALLEKLKEFEGLKDKMLRVAADFENARKRLTRERDEFAKFAQENLISRLLPILDNFERALIHAVEVEDPKAKGLITGIQMVLKQLSDIFKNQGLKRVETVGKHFDAHLHEVVSYVEGEGVDHEIVEEVEPGYILHERLLRAAKVRVRIIPSKK